jgi:hypothetical protein
MPININDKTVIDDNRNLEVNTFIFNSANSFISVTDSAALYGYASGGETSPGVRQNIVDRFPFSTDTNASDVGDMSSARSFLAGQSSLTHGYNSGGALIGSTPGANDTIDKFPFASSSFTASDIGNLSQSRIAVAGQSSETYGFTSGGSGTGPTFISTNVVDSFPFSSDTNASNFGDLSAARGYVSGQSSSTHGYTSGGDTGGDAGPVVLVNTVDKFSFATSLNNAEDVGDLSVARDQTAGNSSDSAGYVIGGSIVPGTSSTVDKFPFATNTPVTAITSLPAGRTRAAGQSSFAFGYNTTISSPSASIQKFSFVTDSSFSGVGDLSTERDESAGQNV